jgi:hypothetical protein
MFVQTALLLRSVTLSLTDCIYMIKSWSDEAFPPIVRVRKH